MERTVERTRGRRGSAGAAGRQTVYLRAERTPGGAMARSRRRDRRSRRGRWATLLAAALLGSAAVLGTAACGEPSTSETEALAPPAFIEVVVELREAERELAAADSAAERFAERKDEILSRHEVTEEDLRRFLVRHEQDLALLQEVWDSINQRLKHVPEPGQGPGGLRSRERPD